jgi:hypothetical protein
MILIPEVLVSLTSSNGMKAAGLPEGREIGCETGNLCVFSAEKGWGKETVIEAGAMGVRFDSIEAIERGNAENETKCGK